MSAVLRWFGVVVFSLVSLLGLALALPSGGLSMLLGGPAMFVTAWLVGNDPADQPDATPGSLVALGVGVLIMAWVFACIALDTTILGRHHGG